MGNQSLADKKIRRITWVFLAIGTFEFVYVLVDSFIQPLGFEYIGFFLVGLVISFAFDRLNHLEWSSIQSNVTLVMNVSSIVLLLTWLFIRYQMLPPLFDRVQVGHAENAILLISSGIFLGRTALMWRDVQIVLSRQFHLQQLDKLR